MAWDNLLHPPHYEDPSLDKNEQTMKQHKCYMPINKFKTEKQADASLPIT
jgi:hypothetical protein